MLELDDYLIDAGNPINWSHPTMLPGVRPVAWWMCLPAFMGGAKWRDLMSSPDLRVGNHGTLTNMVQGTASGWRPSSRPGAWGALQFDGSDDYVVNATGIAQIPGSSAVTVCGYGVTSTNSGGSFNLRYLVAQEDTAVGANWVLRYNTGTKMEFFISPAQGVESTHAVDATAPTIGVWYQWVAVYNGATIKLYRDGVETASVVETRAIRTTQFPLTVGSGYNGTGRAWSGKIDDIQIFNRALTAAEVWTRYRLGMAGYPGVLNRMSVPISGAVSVGGGRIVGSSIVRGLMGGIGRAA